MNIHIIAAAIPPQLDGVGNYTAHLAAELSKTAAVKVLTIEGQAHTPIPGVAIAPVFSVKCPSSMQKVAARVEQDGPDWVLLQYQPFSYGRWGLNLHLPQVMRRIKRGKLGTKFALMVHEPFVHVHNWQSAIMTTWQRWQLWNLGRTADVTFVSIDPWARRLQRWFPGKPVLHLPVGSNLPHMPISRNEARARLGIPDGTIVLGLFGAMHYPQMRDWVRSAAEAVCQSGQEVLVLYAGSHGKALRDSLGTIPSLAEGPLPGEEVSRRLAAVDIYLTPLVDGVSTRRTTLMAGLQHGLPIVGMKGHSTDEMLLQQDGTSFLLADVLDPAQFSAHVRSLVEQPTRRQQLGKAARSLFEQHFTWGRISNSLLIKLRLVS